ncbi:transcription repressor OFP8-like [Asparagus officinalis]|uniref:transcription repressor OFP8-like n=1 Tax=Asparagus officinalis TaxID=4686 RepID=UPI00098E1751|nr:transcription repressor OFP8-like [Asparagus officinalis]
MEKRGGGNNINLDRSLSFSSSSRILYRPTKPSEATYVVSKVDNEKIKEEGRVRGSVDFYLFDYYGSGKVEAKNVKKKKKHKFLLSNNAYGFSRSSDDNLSNSASSDDESENPWSKSFPPDSFEFYKRPSSRKKKKKKKKKKENEKHNLPSSCSGIPVMKISTDPYVDFCDSMVDMILERQLFGTKDLQALLLCYLSLNSPHNHSIILRAFADVSQVLFGH